MALGFYIGGTTGQADGTLEVVGDQSGATPTSVGDVAIVHLRDSRAGYESTESVVVTAPTDCEVSKDGVTYASTITFTSGQLTGVNVPVYIKRVANTFYGWTGLTTTPRLWSATMADVQAPTQGGSLTATADDTQVSLDWPDATDNTAVTGYDVEYGTTTGYGTSVSPDPTTSTAAVTGLTNGTLYYFRVRAYDAAGNTSSYITASATPTTGATFSDTFTGLDPTRWGTVTAGAGTASIVSGELTIDSSGANADAAGAYLKTVVPAATRTYRNKVKTTQQAASNSTPMFLGIFDGIPPAGASASVVFPKNICMVRVADDGASPYASMTYYDSTGTLQRWNGSAWVTTSATVTDAAYALGNYVYVDIEVTATQFRMTTRDASLNLLHQTAWVNWSAARQPAGSKYVAFGEFMTDALSTIVKSDSFTVS